MIAYFPDPFSLFSASSSPADISVALPGGSIVEIRACGHAAYQVLNLISTDPQDYLCGPFRPGSIIPESWLPPLSGKNNSTEY